MRSAVRMYSMPHSVIRMGLVLRSKRGLPIMFSVFLMVRLSDGCEMNMFAAAFEKLFAL